MFALGAWGALVRRNAVVIFMCIELMINGVNLSLVAFADYLPAANGTGCRVRGAGHSRGRCRGRGRAGDSPGRVPLTADGQRGRSEFDEMVGVTGVTGLTGAAARFERS